LTPPKKPGFWAKLWAQLNNVLIFILLAAAVVVAGLQEWIEFGLILGVVTVNVMIGMIQEGKAEKAAEAIKAMLSSSGRARHRALQLLLLAQVRAICLHPDFYVLDCRSSAAGLVLQAFNAAVHVGDKLTVRLTHVCMLSAANVYRDGKRITLDADQLVPGDIVSIKSGDRLPADMRLLQVSNLQVCTSMRAGAQCFRQQQSAALQLACSTACGSQLKCTGAGCFRAVVCALCARNAGLVVGARLSRVLQRKLHVLVFAASLSQVQEAMLTGESVPISKNLHAVAGPSGLGDRKCMAFSATTVSAGQAVGVVTATGPLAQLVYLAARHVCVPA
jgi:magnesium-transporting ATPase (P-type)